MNFLIRLVHEIHDSGDKAISVVADSTDQTAPKRVFERAIDAFARVDIMDNNPGFGDMVSIEEAKDELRAVAGGSPDT